MRQQNSLFLGAPPQDCIILSAIEKGVLYPKDVQIWIAADERVEQVIVKILVSS
jgi:hypothetical protein